MHSQTNAWGCDFSYLHLYTHLTQTRSLFRFFGGISFFALQVKSSLKAQGKLIHVLVIYISDHVGLVNLISWSDFYIYLLRTSVSKAKVKAGDIRTKSRVSSVNYKNKKVSKIISDETGNYDATSGNLCSSELPRGGACGVWWGLWCIG